MNSSGASSVVSLGLEEGVGLSTGRRCSLKWSLKAGFH